MYRYIVYRDMFRIASLANIQSYETGWMSLAKICKYIFSFVEIAWLYVIKAYKSLSIYSSSSRVSWWEEDTAAGLTSMKTQQTGVNQAPQADNKSSVGSCPHLSVCSHTVSKPLTIYFSKWHHDLANHLYLYLMKLKCFNSNGNCCSWTVLTKEAYCSNYFTPRAGILLQLLTLHHRQTQKLAQDHGWSLTLVSRLSICSLCAKYTNCVNHACAAKSPNRQHIFHWHLYKQAVTGAYFPDSDKEALSAHFCINEQQ